MSDEEKTTDPLHITEEMRKAGVLALLETELKSGTNSISWSVFIERWFGLVLKAPRIIPCQLAARAEPSNSETRTRLAGRPDSSSGGAHQRHAR